jgi:hypothetical protein
MYSGKIAVPPGGGGIVDKIIIIIIICMVNEVMEHMENNKICRFTCLLPRGI